MSNWSKLKQALVSIAKKAISKNKNVEYKFILDGTNSDIFFKVGPVESKEYGKKYSYYIEIDGISYEEDGEENFSWDEVNFFDTIEEMLQLLMRQYKSAGIEKAIISGNTKNLQESIQQLEKLTGKKVQLRESENLNPLNFILSKISMVIHEADDETRKYKFIIPGYKTSLFIKTRVNPKGKEVIYFNLSPLEVPKEELDWPAEQQSTHADFEDYIDSVILLMNKVEKFIADWNIINLLKK